MKRVLAVFIIAIVSLWWTSSVADNLKPSATSDYIEARLEFNELKSKWTKKKENAALSSRTSDYWKGSAGQEIIAMGKHALPFVMDEISKGDFFFNIPAQEITKIKTPSGFERESEQKLSQDWIEWWKENKDNPEWNIYINNKVNANPHR